MANKNKSKLINKINPTIDNFREGLNSFSCFEIGIVYALIQIDSNLFSFISGIVVNLPISLLFSVVALKIVYTTAGIAQLILYIISLISAIIMSVLIIQLTLKHIEINKIFDTVNSEIKTNKCVEFCVNEKEIIVKIKNKIKLFIFASILLVCSLIALFIILNTCL